MENVAIAGLHMTDYDGKYMKSPLTLEDARSIGAVLWTMGYRLTEEDRHS